MINLDEIRYQFEKNYQYKKVAITFQIFSF